VVVYLLRREDKLSVTMILLADGISVKHCNTVRIPEIFQGLLVLIFNKPIIDEPIRMW